jgi:hypothetical protein
MTTPSPRPSTASPLTTLAATARKADRHLLADLHRSRIAADRAMRRLGAVERHALLHLRSTANRHRPRRASE